MSAIGPGDLVECVNDANTIWVKRGRIYLVTAVRHPYLYLAGVADGNRDNGMWASRFRPVRRDELQIFRDIVAKPMEVA